MILPERIRDLRLNSVSTRSDSNHAFEQGAFLLALTDERVRDQRAPFDHPSICVPHGHETTASGIQVDAAGNAVDVMQCIAAVGAAGAGVPLQPFLQLDPFRR